MHHYISSYNKNILNKTSKNPKTFKKHKAKQKATQSTQN